MKKRKKGLVLSLLGILGLMVMTFGVTYAFFNYTKRGTTENTLTTGTLTFLYTEVEANGAGITIEEAFPMDDATGKSQIGSGKVFNFTVQANTKGKAAIDYEITARKKDTSDLEEGAVKLYLTEVNGDSEKELLLDTYNNLIPTSVEVSENTVEKTIYTGKVPSNMINYQKDFRLRMWVDSSVDYSSGNYNGKTFKISVNVYANARVVTQEELDLETSTEVTSMFAGDAEFEEVTDKDYEYEVAVPEGTTETTLDIQTKNPNATVEVQKLDSLADINNVSSTKNYVVKKLSTSKTVQLTGINNYFRVTIISENGKIKDSFIINIIIESPIAYIFNGTEVLNANVIESGGTNINTWKIENGTFIITSVSGWSASQIIFDEIEIDSTRYNKLIIEAAWTKGYDYGLDLYDIDNNHILVCNSGNKGDVLYKLGRNNFGKTTFEVDLTEKNKIKQISFNNSSLSAKWTIYSIRFEK